MIAVGQDPLGKQGKRIRDDGDLELWVKDLAGKKYAVALLNRSSVPADITFSWQELGLKGKKKMVRDLWLHKNIGKFKESFTGKNIQSHDAMILLISR